MRKFKFNLSMEELKKRTHKDYLIKKKFLKPDAPEYLELAEGDKKALKHLVRAANVIGRINMQLDCHDNIEFEEFLKAEIKAGNEQAKLTKILFDAQKGMNAIDTMSEKINLAKGIKELPGKGVYPKDLSKEEFHKIIKDMIKSNKVEEVKRLLTQRSVVERSGDHLVGIDYVDKFRDEFEKAAEELGIEIISVPGMYTSNDIPYMNANIDGLCHAENQVTIGGETIEGLGGFEIKTSSRGEGFSEDEIPDSYYCQVQHYMAVTNLSWFILTAFFMNTKRVRNYVIRRNDDFIYSRLLPAEKDFWENYVLTNNPPEPLGIDSESEYTANLNIADTVELDTETEDLIAQRMEVQQQIKDLEQKESALKDSILIKLSALSHSDSATAEKVNGAGERFKLSYNLQKKYSVDTDALKKSGLFDDYKKESAYRILRISEKK